MARECGTCAGAAVAVRVRPARAADAPARAALLREVYAEYNADAFLLFFFQEATLEGVVLCGAVLFIFCGAPAAACLLLPPAAAALLALAVRLRHARLARNHAQWMAGEWGGWVAEAAGAPPPPGAAVAVCVRAAHAAHAGHALSDERDGDGDGEHEAVRFTQVVGTVSLCGGGGGGGGEGWGAARLAGLCVARAWRRRGVGGALAGAARAGGAARGLAALHAPLSELQTAARALLLARGWRVRAAARLPLAAGLLSLRVAHLVADLPHA